MIPFEKFTDRAISKVKRAVLRFVANPLSEKLIAGEITDGSSVKVGYRAGEFSFEVARGVGSE